MLLPTFAPHRLRRLFVPTRRGLAIALLLVASPAALLAGPATASTDASSDPSPNKDQYHLFHPTPVQLLRSFSTDRPSISTGPVTIDAGHFQLEADFVNYVQDRHNPSRAPVDVDQWNVLPFDLRIGLSNHVELDLVFGSYLNQRTRDRSVSGATATQTRSGIGDFTLQLKVNLLGNDRGSIGLALLPFLKVPTNTANLGNDSVEGGLGVPFSAALPYGFSLGLYTQFSAVRNGTDTGYDAAFGNAISLGHTLFTEKLSAFVEFYSFVTSARNAPVSGQVETGLVYNVLPNVEVDLGCYFGVTRAAPDFQIFTGFSFRY